MMVEQNFKFTIDRQRIEPKTNQAQNDQILLQDNNYNFTDLHQPDMAKFSSNSGSIPLLGPQSTEKKQSAMKSPLIQNKLLKEVESASVFNTQDHYISERIEKTLEKYSKKQIIKNNSPFLNQNGKSRNNQNQSNSASKIYSSTFKGIANKGSVVLNQSPYINGGIYNTQVPQEDNQLSNFDILPSFEDKPSYMRKFDHSSAEKRLNDLSFDSLNPMNNSFTNGQKETFSISKVDSNYHQINNLNIIKVKPQFQKLIKVTHQFQQEPSQNSSNYFTLSNTNDYQPSSQSLDKNHYPDNYPSIKNPHSQWWSQQMNSQSFLPYPSIPSSNTNMDSQLLYQLNQQQYPSSAQVSPFQQSKSRDGGYRNIPMRDFSSISDQSPSKLQENQDPHPFKGPKLHLFKKGNSRRIKTSSATRNLQPIQPLDSNKLAANFNSINAGGINTVQNQQKDFSFMKVQSKEQEYGLSMDLQNKDNKQFNPNNEIQKATGGILNVYTNEGLNYDNRLNISLNKKLQNNVRPNTTHLDQLVSETSPKRQLIFMGAATNNLVDPLINKQLTKGELQEEINGFKHSFYNEKSDQLLGNQEQQTDNVYMGNYQSDASQYLSVGEGGGDNSNNIKHIFVLNMDSNVNGQVNNMTSNQQSTQESKAMTPCFIHTPNMTNKWGNFNPTAVGGNDKLDTENEQKELLFVKDKSIKAPPQFKKPMTSHQQSKTQQIPSSTSKSKDKFLTQKNQADIIKLGPQDIYLGGGPNTQSSRNAANLALNNKPQTSNSFRRPLSRNHPILNNISQQASSCFEQQHVYYQQRAIPEKLTVQKQNQSKGKSPLQQTFSSFKGSYGGNSQKNQQNGQIKEQSKEEEEYDQ